MTALKFPWRREEMRDYTRDLADKGSYTELLTTDPSPPVDNKFQHAIDFDVAAFADENPERWLGSILRDKAELEVIGDLLAALDTALDEIKDATYDIDFVKAPSWPQVVVAAKAMLATMDRLDAASSQGHPPSR